jgi:hypothetical protein
MPLGQQQLQVVHDWLKNWFGCRCPVCKGQTFIFQDMVALPVTFGGGQTSPTRCALFRSPAATVAT